MGLHPHWLHHHAVARYSSVILFCYTACMFTTNSAQLNQLATMLFIFAVLATGLYVGRDLLFPLAVAFLIWFVTTSYRRLISRTPLIGRRLSKVSLTVISFLISLFTLIICGTIVVLSVGQFNIAYDLYSQNLISHIETASSYTGVDINAVLTPQDALSLESRLQNMFTLATGFFTTTILVLFYLFFIFIEESTFRQKVNESISDPDAQKDAHEIIASITHSVHRYLSLKTLISIGTGVAAYIVMLPIGLDFAVLASFLIFLFNYIPNLGPFIGTGIAVAFALLQFDVLLPALYILITVGTVQVISGNIVEPIIMGHSLNLSPLVIMVALVFWGYIWGIFGMFIAVPLTVVLMIILAHIPQTRIVAIWMSERGRV